MLRVPESYSESSRRIWNHFYYRIMAGDSSWWEEQIDILAQENHEDAVAVLLDILAGYGKSAYFSLSDWADMVEFVCRLAFEEKLQHLIIPCLPTLASILATPVDPYLLDLDFIVEAFIHLNIHNYPYVISSLIESIRHLSRLTDFAYKDTALVPLWDALRMFDDDALAPYKMVIQALGDPPHA
jgi:hypothetical protein